MFEVKNKVNRTVLGDVVLMSLLLNLNANPETILNVFIPNFEHLLGRHNKVHKPEAVTRRCSAKILKILKKALV